MKESKTKQLSDTAIVHARHITDPTATQGDCVVQSVTRLSADIGAFVGKEKNDANINYLRQLDDITQQFVEHNKRNAASPVQVTTMLEVTLDIANKDHLKTRQSAHVAARAKVDANLLRAAKAKVRVMSSPCQI